ncbi:MAG: AAA family ATPase [Acidobacteriota bacterium]|nr:AAA family ATPase [Acidobacteriota bacterium]
MELRDPNKPSIDPRRLVRERGKDALADLLAATGYIPQSHTLSDVALALRQFHPILFGGSRGSGKTSLGEGLAQSCNLSLFYVPGVEGLTVREILGGWRQRAQERAIQQLLRGGIEAVDARSLVWTEEFYELGEFLEAFAYAKKAADRGEPPPVLILDEVDKLELKIQNLLLQPLARGWASVPKLEGVIGVRRREQMPIVALTTNNLKMLSEPLRSRCFVTWMELAQPEEEVRILRARVPRASAYLIGATVKITQLIKWDMPQVRDKPGLRESIDLLTALVDDRVTLLTEDVIAEYLACLGKEQKELSSLRKALARLEEAANEEHPEIDTWVEVAFASREGTNTANMEDLEEVSA